MATYGSCFQGSARRIAAGRLSLAIAFAVAGLGPAAAVSPRCAVADRFLDLPVKLRNAKAAVREGRPVRLLVLGPGIAGPNLSERHRTRLLRELETRLPQVEFELLSEGRSAVLVSDAFDRMRDDLPNARPDLLVWQVGTPDALAGTEPSVFAEKLTRAVEWLKTQPADLVLMDPLFVEGVDHEKAYWGIAAAMDEVARRTGVNLFRRYAMTQALELTRRGGDKDDPSAQKRGCSPELLAEAIGRSLDRAASR